MSKHFHVKWFRRLIIATLGLVCLGGAPGGAQGMEPILGPLKVERTTGSPHRFAAELSNCEPQARYELVVLNGNPDGPNRVSSASIRLNGVEVVRPADLNQRVSRVARAAAIAPANRLEVELASQPGSFLTVSVECTASCLGIEILSPIPNSTVQGSAVVTGRVTSSAGEIGVLVNGLPVPTHDTTFAGRAARLDSGPNTIEAVAVNACLHRAAASIQVTAEEDESPIHLMASPVTGTAPLAVSLWTDLDPIPAIAAVEWDFEGDGVVDAAGASPGELTHVYPAAGLFLPTVTLTDLQGNRWSGRSVVQALSPEGVTELAERKWVGLQDALARGDVAGALRFVAGSKREVYRDAFEALSPALVQVAEALDDGLELRSVRAGKAVFTAHAVVDGVAREVWMELVQDTDGLWRISFF